MSSSLHTTAAKSSRVTKPTRRKSNNPLLRRSSSSLAASPRRKSSSESATNVGAVGDESVFDEPLDDTGRVASLATDLELRDVPQFIQNIRTRMFTSVPERASGMNGQKTAEVLNFRMNLPPVVSVAHVHALSRSPTVTEREIAELTRAGIIRKVVIPGRGAGGAAVGEGLVLVSEWERLVRSHPGLEDEMKEKYISLLRSQPTSATVSAAQLGKDEIAAFCGTGFLTSANPSAGNAEVFSRPGAASLGSLASSSAKAASGSLNAVGGAHAFTSSGASGGGVVSTDRQRTAPGGVYSFALPNMGPYLRLLTTARVHLLSLLSKTSRYKEAPVSLLKERWDGGIAGEDLASKARKARGDFTGVLPGRTKKWKTFHGLSFEWVLEECTGSGLVELFQTHSVGVGVRAA
ncbi:serine-threonine protein kinase 19 protein [Diplodia corticola]|uniref:Serine-threonine protein kinase 19 protein n=1 Tax=Diplodia corticola TaxID=236234 RepID=A0A1J9QWJ9_9PEZI|nr:serine-threonine protein kinase 19 protein [Diplodia corticola]OJD32800.1 serine-threonine protein kinase 19 protein [Diplodia corticola]